MSYLSYPIPLVLPPSRNAKIHLISPIRNNTRVMLFLNFTPKSLVFTRSVSLTGSVVPLRIIQSPYVPPVTLLNPLFLRVTPASSSPPHVWYTPEHPTKFLKVGTTLG